jgi:hypothetical protein
MYISDFLKWSPGRALPPHRQLFFSTHMEDTKASSTTYLVQDAQALGITSAPGSSWDDYPSMCPFFREVMRTTMTPKAFVELYYTASTFEKIFGLITARFEMVPIFRKEGKIFVELGKKSQAPYRPIFACMQSLLKHNLQTIEDNIRNNQRDSISRGFQNIAFVTASRVKMTTEVVSERFNALSSFTRPQYGEDVQSTSVDGFFPYFSNRSDALGEIMFYFHHSNLKGPALVTAPVQEREAAITFLRARSTLHTFDKFCAVCGKTGGLLKCPCKRVRYCCAECQHADWPEHRAGCSGK